VQQVATRTVLCGSTLRACAAHEAIRAAADAGFDALSLWGVMVERSVLAGWSLASLRALLGDCGIAADCVEPVRDWAAGAEAQDGVPLGRLLDMAEALGATSILASTADGGTAGELELLAERASQQGLVVGLEFLGWGPVTSLRAAWALVEDSGRQDVGIVYDSWHQHRGSGSVGEVALVPPERFVMVQLADGPARGEADPVLEARYRRLLPGDGAMGVAGQMHRLMAHGVRAPVGVEVWTEGNQVDPSSAASRAMSSLRAVLEAAGSSLDSFGQ
jgi:sugar phosphate isomerase/epimerase